MALSYLQLATLIITSFVVGNLCTYLIMKHRISALKDYIGTLDASLKGMWDDHENKHKKNQQKNPKPSRDLKDRKQPIQAKHASDQQILSKSTSK